MTYEPGQHVNVYHGAEELFGVVERVVDGFVHVSTSLGSVVWDEPAEGLFMSEAHRVFPLAMVLSA